jgi:hypothetical protein
MEKGKKDALTVAALEFGFNRAVEGNYADCHQALPPFGTRWGRGILVRNPEGLDAIIGSCGSSHAQLKKSMGSDERSAGTFYYGYETGTQTLYLQYASDKTFDFQDKKTLNAILNALRRSVGPLMGFTAPGAENGREAGSESLDDVLRRLGIA